MKMNSLLQNSIQGRNLHDIDPDLPSGIIRVKEGYLKSKPIPPSNDCFISGRFDILTEMEDGQYTVIDFKITDPKEEKLEKFTRQLHAYKFALENPQMGASKKVVKMGVVVVSPESIHIDKGGFVFTTKPKWFPIKEDMKGFFDFITQVSRLLNGPVPSPSQNCLWCKYRICFSSPTKSKQLEMAG